MLVSTLPRLLPAWAQRSPILDAYDSRGAIAIWTPRANLAVTQASGVLTEELATRWITAVAPLWLRPGRWTFCSDWQYMTSYDSRARSLLTKLVLDEYQHIAASYFLTGSKLVAMGVATAGAATALVGVRLHATTNRAEWDRWLAESERG